MIRWRSLVKWTMFNIPIAMSMSDEYFMKITKMITTPCVFFCWRVVGIVVVTPNTYIHAMTLR